jgi:hypothetical protein
MQALLLDRKEAAKSLLENLKRLYIQLAPKDQEAVRGSILANCLSQTGSN